MKTASITLESLISFVPGVPETLIRAVVAQVGSWDYFETIAPDVANHGADSGFTGFTYHADTVKFWNANRLAIRDYAIAEAVNCDFSSAAAMVEWFRCVEAHQDEINLVLFSDITEDAVFTDERDLHLIANALAWYALEEVSRAYVDAVEAAAE